jgi:hypothetical protein
MANAAAYGGIGGGFHTLQMTMNLPTGVVIAGSNTIAFQFNQTDGRVSGFRVLAFNVQAADGSFLIPASTFVNEDPNTWQPPSTAASDIATGQTLWQQAALTTPIVTGGTQPILAHCSDCHAQNGRDLKVLQLFEQFDSGAVRVSWAHGAARQPDRQLHTLPQRSKSRPAVESTLSARFGFGLAAGGSMVGGSRAGRSTCERSGHDEPAFSQWHSVRLLLSHGSPG